MLFTGIKNEINVIPSCTEGKGDDILVGAGRSSKYKKNLKNK